MKTFLTLIIALTTLTYSQTERFILLNKQKIYLRENPAYISVKFKMNTSAGAAENIVSSKLAEMKNKSWNMVYKTASDINSVNVLVKLNDNLNSIKLNKQLQLLRTQMNVEYVGKCYQTNDKVLHYTTNEVIVKFKKNVSRFDIDNLNRLFDTRVIKKIDNFDDVYLLSLNNKGENGKNDAFDVANEYALTSFVEFAQPNFIRTGMLVGEFTKTKISSLPDDSLVSQMWHIKNTGNNIPENIPGIPGCDINADSAWNITTGNPNVLIAITDTGIDTLHTDLIPNFSERNLWYDAYEEDNMPEDEYSHGTGVTGVSSAVGNNHIGTVGVAYNCKFIPIRIFGPWPAAFTTDLIIAKGMNWAWQHGASVINCSWGGGIPSPLLEHAIINAFTYGRNGKGTVICGGVGNADTNIVIYPASRQGVIGAGGLSPCNERKSKHSCDNLDDTLQNWGACFGDGLSVVVPCTYIGTTQLSHDWCICGNGTSVSAPIVSGVAALIISKNINISGDSVRIIMERTAKKVGPYSYNIPKENGMWNYEMGYGKLDAKACLDATPQGPLNTYDMIPPIVKIFPPESGQIDAPFVDAVITDNQFIANGSNAPRMYFYSSQNPYTQFVNGSVIGSNTYRFNFPTLNFGTRAYYYIAAQDTSSNRNVTTYPIGGKGTNPPGTIAPLKKMFFQNTTKYTQGFVSTNVPLIISTERETTVVSVMNCTVNKTLLDVDCRINIEHTFDADITIALVSPSGTEIILTGGTGLNGDNYTNTIFSDEATIAIDDTSQHSPYTGTYRPVEKLWFFDGENSLGEWKLKVVDNGPYDGGQLLAWDVVFTYSAYDDNTQFPTTFSLVKNYPNPFNPGTRIVFNVPHRANIRLVLFDVLGREVGTLLNETRSSGFNEFTDFNINDSKLNGGSGLASGVYFVSMFADNLYIQSMKMMLIK